MKADVFLEELLQIMESKVHWAWPSFTDGVVSKERLNIHFEQEYEVYIRDFPVFIGRGFIQCPVPEVRRELAENLFEEETGGLVAGMPHPELFLRYPRGLGYDLSRFENVELLPNAIRYREYLDRATLDMGWAVSATVSTIFIEGTPYERGEVDVAAEKRPENPLSEHPLVKHYGLEEADLALTKAHREVEGEHRGAAWKIVKDYVPASERAEVIAVMKEVCHLWKAYRDDVAMACGLNPGG
jgi:pyrroloquinoline-quinone synthase